MIPAPVQIFIDRFLKLGVAVSTLVFVLAGVAITLEGEAAVDMGAAAFMTGRGVKRGAKGASEAKRRSVSIIVLVSLHSRGSNPDVVIANPYKNTHAHFLPQLQPPRFRIRSPPASTASLSVWSNLTSHQDCLCCLVSA